uniref:6-phosphogluconolactonase n=1 Tax=Hirondellea gigas TaxID=1518452 RepID=A0A2P2I5T2_9CRUS
MSQPTLKIVEKVLGSKDELAKELAQLIERAAAEAIKDRGLFTIGLSGGSLIKFVCNEVPSITTDWSSWRLLLCDERMVPLTSPDSTLAAYIDGLVSATPLTQQQFLAVDTDKTAAEAATLYEQKIRELCGDSSASLPVLDLLLLGVGPDGHTASLFPGHPLLGEKTAWVAAITDSPKPPPSRVTLTLPVINSARCCVLALSGAEKADMIKRLRRERDSPVCADHLPASMVRPYNGELVWLLDAAAAAV